MPVALPAPDQVNLDPPDASEVEWLSRGIVTATMPAGGMGHVQQMLLEAVVPAMTGFPVSLDRPPLAPAEFAGGLAHRDAAFRGRIVQVMVLQALVLRPLPADVAGRVAAYAAELGVDDKMLEVAQGFARGNLGLAAVDFDRNGYSAELGGETPTALHTSKALDDAWAFSVADDHLARRWADLETLPEGTLGRRITEFYRARGFAYPGRPGSAPPLLAQHDWVHVLADYGTTVESELEVFAFIARANDDLRAFSLLAMVVSLFETGYLATGAGLFQSDTGHLARAGMAARVADAMRRGALCRGSIDFMTTDWFQLAALPVEEVRRHFGVPDKSPAAVAAGSIGPWEAGGISRYQLEAGATLAAQQQRPYDSYGADLRG